MSYYGKLHLTGQKASLLLATTILTAVVSMLCLIQLTSIYLFIPVVLIALLLFTDLIHSEKKSSAYFLESEIIINRTFAFGLLVMIIRKRLAEEEANALRDYFMLLEQNGIEKLSSYAIDELARANIIFYSNEPVFP